MTNSPDPATTNTSFARQRPRGDGGPPALISPDRMAALLVAQRSARGLDTDELAARSGGSFTAGFLNRAEQGLVILTDPVARKLAALYEVEHGQVLPERKNRLIVDLPGRRLAVGSQSYELAQSTEPLSGDQLVDAVLERYLSLLYVMRGLEPGSDLSIRDADLGVLGESLEVELAFLERRLAQLMLDDRVDSRTKSLIGRFLLPNAGLLVAATAIGSFIISSVAPQDMVRAEEAAGAGSDLVAAQQLIEAPDFPTTTVAVPTQNATTVPVQDTDSQAPGKVDTTNNAGGTAADTDRLSPSSPVAERSADADGASNRDQSGEREQADDAAVHAESSEDVLTDDGHAHGHEGAEAPAQAEPPTPEPNEASPASPAELGADAEALIAYDWQSALPGWTVTYLDDRPGFRGLTFPQAKAIEIYVDPGDTPGSIAEILAHELGHAIDVTYFDDGDRSRWIEARNMPAVWWAGDGLNDFSVGAGDFAEAVARLWVDSPSNSTYGEFTPEQLELVRQLLP